MTRNVLGDAADLLARHYGPLPESGPPGEWITIVRVILERGRAVKNGRDWSWVLSGHHITIRCTGDSEANRAFGGPMYYGHTPDGYSQRNVFFHQTRAVLSVFESLTEQQRTQAVPLGDLTRSPLHRFGRNRNLCRVYPRGTTCRRTTARSRPSSTALASSGAGDRPPTAVTSHW